MPRVERPSPDQVYFTTAVQDVLGFTVWIRTTSDQAIPASSLSLAQEAVEKGKFTAGSPASKIQNYFTRTFGEAGNPFAVKLRIEKLGQSGLWTPSYFKAESDTGFTEIAIRTKAELFPEIELTGTHYHIDEPIGRMKASFAVKESLIGTIPGLVDLGPSQP